MIVVGAGNLALDIVYSLEMDYAKEEIVFYLEPQYEPHPIIAARFEIIREERLLRQHFIEIGNTFIIAIGDNHLRERYATIITNLGGENRSFISTRALVGNYNTIAPLGVIVMCTARITNAVTIQEGSIIYCNASIAHNMIIGRYTLVSSDTTMCEATIGDYCLIGFGARLKQGIELGKNIIVGIGSVVTRSYPEKSILAGNPARIISQNEV